MPLKVVQDNTHAQCPVPTPLLFFSYTVPTNRILSPMLKPKILSHRKNVNQFQKKEYQKDGNFIISTNTFLDWGGGILRNQGVLLFTPLKVIWFYYGPSLINQHITGSIKFQMFKMSFFQLVKVQFCNFDLHTYSDLASELHTQRTIFGVYEQKKTYIILSTQSSALLVTYQRFIRQLTATFYQ